MNGVGRGWVCVSELFFFGSFVLSNRTNTFQNNTPSVNEGGCGTIAPANDISASVLGTMPSKPSVYERGPIRPDNIEYIFKDKWCV